MPLDGIETRSLPSTSPILRFLSASSTAPFTSARARSMKRRRFPRLLPFGLARRSTMFMICAPLSPPSAGLVDPHIPFDQPADLPLGISARGHAVDELGVLLVALAVLLRPEADHRQQVLDLAEHPLLDHLAQLL